MSVCVCVCVCVRACVHACVVRACLRVCGCVCVCLCVILFRGNTAVTLYCVTIDSPTIQAQNWWQRWDSNSDHQSSSNSATATSCGVDMRATEGSHKHPHWRTNNIKPLCIWLYENSGRSRPGRNRCRPPLNLDQLCFLKPILYQNASQ